jgi:hypothetical protein
MRRLKKGEKKKRIHRNIRWLLFLKSSPVIRRKRREASIARELVGRRRRKERGRKKT